jgi:hypothetical protein
MYALRYKQTNSFFSRYLKERKKWKDYLGTNDTEDVEMSGMGGLLTSVSRPSEFVTSVCKEQEGEQDTTGLTAATRNTVQANETLVFRPVYSYKSENWREEITFKNRASAEAHYGKLGWGQTDSNAEKKQEEQEVQEKQEEQDIELPYRYTTAEEDVETEDDSENTTEDVVSTLSRCSYQACLNGANNL